MPQTQETQTNIRFVSYAERLARREQWEEMREQQLLAEANATESRTVH